MEDPGLPWLMEGAALEGARPDPHFVGYSAFPRLQRDHPGARSPAHLHTCCEFCTRRPLSHLEEGPPNFLRPSGWVMLNT